MLLKLPRWITEAIVSIGGNTTTFTRSLSASSPRKGSALQTLAYSFQVWMR